MRIAAIDQGTTSTRCLVVDSSKVELVSAIRHTQSHPARGWVEHDPEELLQNIRSVLQSAGSVDAIALANQGESCLAWDAHTGEPLSPIIVWQDSRTAAHLQQMSESSKAQSVRITGLPLDPYFSASKLGWLLANCPKVGEAYRNKRLRLGTTDAFFIQRLTGEFLTDVATASRTGLMDLGQQKWSAEMCNLHGIPMDVLPPIVPVNHGFGRIEGIPLQASTVDQQAALFGHGCSEVGQSKITFGTGAFFLAVAGGSLPEKSNLLPTIAWQFEECPVAFAIEGGVYDAGAALEWAKSIGLFNSVQELSDLDGPSALSKGIVFVPALSGLAAPHWDRTAAPLFIGMNHATTRTDLIRAVLEGVAMLAADLVEAAGKEIPLKNPVSIDGGLSQNKYFAQFLASACQKVVKVPAMFELSALGLAGMCGLDVGGLRGSTVTFEPDESISQSDRTRFSIALSRARGWHLESVVD